LGRAPAQDVFLGILRTADLLQTELAELLKTLDLSPTQYNVMRILRDAGKEGLACGRIADRMLTRDPDMTRLLDRLEKRALIERSRDKSDRRVVKTHITDAGRALLASMDEPVLELHREQFAGVGARDLKTLAALLGNVRERRV
jgi:DNA-binding MarR family transcriptional regulator